MSSEELDEFERETQRRVNRRPLGLYLCAITAAASLLLYVWSVHKWGATWV